MANKSMWFAPDGGAVIDLDHVAAAMWMWEDIDGNKVAPGHPNAARHCLYVWLLPATAVADEEIVLDVEDGVSFMEALRVCRGLVL